MRGRLRGRRSKTFDPRTALRPRTYVRTRSWTRSFYLHLDCSSVLFLGLSCKWDLALCTLPCTVNPIIAHDSAQKSQQGTPPSQLTPFVRLTLRALLTLHYCKGKEGTSQHQRSAWTRRGERRSVRTKIPAQQSRLGDDMTHQCCTPKYE